MINLPAGPMQLVQFVIRWSILVLCCVATIGYAEERIDLSGTWQYRFDPIGYGEEKGWQEPGHRTWNTIEVPGSFNTEQEKWYNGIVWYRRSFHLSQHWADEHFFLQFLAVNLRCKVWVNGEFVGENIFPYLPFQFDITSVVRPGETNWVVVQVNNEIIEEAVPDRNWHGWWNFGGIIREVYLIHRPALFTNEVIVRTSLTGENNWNLELLLNTYNLEETTKATFEVSLLDQTGRRIWNGVGQRQVLAGRTQFSFNIHQENVRPWSPDDPYLYSIRVITSQEDRNLQHQWLQQFGFREIRIDGTQLVLNDKPLTIRGVSRHEMYPEVEMSPSRDHIRSDLEAIKNLGCNFIRTAHYANHPDFYELADEMGFLVWSEIPAWQTSTDVLTDRAVWNNCIRPQLETLVTYYRSHPCIIIWSVGNEFDSDTEPGARYAERATNFVRGLDPDRLVTFASDRHRPGQLDQSFRFVDIIAVNEY